jgi:selenide,water dikinase
VDDPADFGRITAANSLSDVYAMGGTPLTALNIVGFPDGDLPEEVLVEILRGSGEVCREAGVVVAGGHTVTDRELKFGLAVTGILDPRRPMLANAGARPGDLLVLTKPLGTGLISNAMMNDAAPEGSVAAMTEAMIRLNDVAATNALRHGARAATDITGYGLLGHAREMAAASGVRIVLDAGALPALPGALEVGRSGSFYSGGERRNLDFVRRVLRVEGEVPDELLRLASDPQTSGGLLVALEPEAAVAYRESLEGAGGAWHVGRVEEGAGELTLAAPGEAR